MNSTHISTERFNTRLKLANAAMRAMNQLTDLDNGTIHNPYELASSTMHDGRTLIETIYEDGEVRYNDGWHIVEVDEQTMYVDYTARAAQEVGEYDHISDFDEEE